MTISPLLEQHWRPLAARHTPGAWPFLLAAYGEAHRSYHTHAHVAELLDGLDERRALATRADLVATAIFWHDCIYVTREPDGRLRPDRDNVRASAEAFLAHSRFPQADARAVFDMIMATAEHLSAHATTEYYPGFAKDLDLMCDLDLASLGAPEAIFDANFDRVRFEFDFIPQPEFLRRQLRFFEHLRSGAHTIFRRAEIRAALEAPAQANVSRWIAKLETMLAA